MQWREPFDRFWEKVDKDGPVPAHRPDLGPCWVWTAALCKGYAQFWDGQRQRRAHRWFWEQENGPVPDGLELDHLCRNRACVRPSHLEAVTGKVNCERGNTGQNNAQKTHCPHGHSLEDAYRGSKGERKCASCAKKRASDRYYAKVRKAS